MAEKTVKIRLPESPEKLQEIIDFLEKHGAISKEQAEKLKVPSSQDKSKWALLAERFRSEKEGHLNGISDKVKDHIQEFRESFHI